ncbi:phosphoribosyltransferase [Plectonema cf. radiosum LEGE 06105]|uniref:Phosphoribosyltransferase n=1 Tax=Plectonema cf. radiosum LEGE 06105 TaxID=945769 RepID=A0A8J7F4X4_9CYAN|nr:phosphoribosyltransferase family protein [Plectonema radiosum]MBE9215205.1 phosphoribosyltransferase [Plectonema cf. radiosum LEGE 06105]
MLYNPLFQNREAAGVELAQAIRTQLNKQAVETGLKPIPIVYALPRGGLPVALPVARLLDCPLNIEVAKKISHPQNEELAIGAVTASGSVVWSDNRLFRFKFYSREKHQASLNTAMDCAKSLEAQLSPACPQVNPQGATIILVDDGIATGMTIAAAATSLRKLNPAQIWLCTPVAPEKLIPWLHKWGEKVIVLATPTSFLSVSNFYVEFPQVETQQALEYLQQQPIKG